MKKIPFHIFTFFSILIFVFSIQAVLPQKAFADEKLEGPSTVDAYTPFIINMSDLVIGNCYAISITTKTEIILPSSTQSFGRFCYQGHDKREIYYSRVAEFTKNVLSIEPQKADKYYIAIGGQQSSTSKFSPIKTIVVNVLVPPIPTSAPTPTPGGPTLTPTPPTACNPSGTDPNTGKCLDNKCEKDISGTCVPILVFPTSPLAPTFTPTSTTPVPPALLPCLAGEDINGVPITEKQIKDNPDRKRDIVKCTKIDSAIGEIDTDPAAFIKKIFTVLLSMAGGWAVYLIITAGYQLMFSQGDAEGVKEAQEKITSAVVGIIFMILSLIILRVIGVDIFQLPTFVKP
ncbi:MAG: hypothetical protein HYV37_00255 [Candidatus Levyibacteriota bacterium]|nr:MAG: hypothetical protein HYV37_00255 [Candidatus Levybacteria bacterium]